MDESAQATGPHGLRGSGRVGVSAAEAAGHVVGVDASRNRSGGAKAHLVGLLGCSDPRRHGIAQVHLWSYRKLLDEIPDAPWLVKHSPAALEQALARQLWWQYRRLPEEARRAGCQVLLNTDAGSVCRFRPSVVMSRDMLSYEPGEIGRYGYGRARARLLALRHIQNASLRQADGAIFLTQHAARVIQSATGPLRRIAIIPHGVGRAFKEAKAIAPDSRSVGHPLRCLYVSNAAPYKHQWHVVRAIAELRRAGLALELKLVGGGSGPALRRMEDEIRRSDPNGRFVECIDFVRSDTLPEVLSRADIFIFASSCENMPNTLIEAMAVGLPIACSDRGPMPEVLGDAGVFFDPEDPATIAAAVARLARDPVLRARCSQRARVLADQYSWERCGGETWDFLNSILLSQS